MFKRVALAVAASAMIAGGAMAAPAAHASTGGQIAQPSCWGRTVECLVATPATPPPLKYQPEDQPPVHYHT